jgi:hypothetical protein
MTWETPEVTDLGSISDHTFINPAGENKGIAVPKADPFGEQSVEGS